MKIAVIGEGAWGTAITQVIRSEHQVYLWCQDPVIAQQLQTQQVNERYLSHVLLKRSITSTNIFTDLTECDLFLVTTPVRFLREVLAKLLKVAQQKPLILLCKGIEEQSLLLPCAIAQELGYEQVSYLAGPSFARGICAGELTALVHVGAVDINLTSIFVDHVIVQAGEDLIGIQMLAAMKNVLSILLGAADGAGFGVNTRAALFAQIVQEMNVLVTHLGGKEHTLLTVAGIGDLFLTGTSKESRNFSFGRLLGQGSSYQQAMAQFAYAEGPQTIRALSGLLIRQSSLARQLPFSVLVTRWASGVVTNYAQSLQQALTLALRTETKSDTDAAI